MKLEKHIQKWYRFSSLKEIGVSGVIALLLLTVLGIWAALFLQPSDTILSNYSRNSIRSFLTVDATHAKDDDAFFHLFMNRLRDNNDVLVLGTSESGFMDSYNYWELLNADTAITTDFGVLYGAGRSCERYIPSMLNHPEIWREQRLLVLVNPVYWREGLSRFNLEYHTRYMNDQEVRNARTKSSRKDDFDLLFGAGATRNITAQVNVFNSFLDKKLHRLFYDRIRGYIGWESEEINHLTVHPQYLSAASRTTPAILTSLRDEILPEFNCTQDFLDQGEYAMNTLILDAPYRNTALDYFIELCRELNINATFVIGPYNQILADACGQQDVIEQHEALEEQLRNTFERENMPYIDATELSAIPGSFKDKQHHSKFGGYLLYKCIKDHWDE
jgi:hypothetical protein